MSAANFSARLSDAGAVGETSIWKGCGSVVVAFGGDSAVNRGTSTAPPTADATASTSDNRPDRNVNADNANVADVTNPNRAYHAFLYFANSVGA